MENISGLLLAQKTPAGAEPPREIFFAKPGQSAPGPDQWCTTLSMISCTSFSSLADAVTTTSLP
jgi:hypothetical protein